jgi:hypothetical protein
MSVLGFQARGDGSASNGPKITTLHAIDSIELSVKTDEALVEELEIV